MHVCADVFIQLNPSSAVPRHLDLLTYEPESTTRNYRHSSLSQWTKDHCILASCISERCLEWQWYAASASSSKDIVHRYTPLLRGVPVDRGVPVVTSLLSLTNQVLAFCCSRQWSVVFFDIDIITPSNRAMFISEASVSSQLYKILTFIVRNFQNIPTPLY